MAKVKVSVTIDSQVLAGIDAEAQAAGMNRSEMIERAMRKEHLRLELERYKKYTVPALKIDEYAAMIHAANLKSGLWDPNS